MGGQFPLFLADTQAEARLLLVLVQLCLIIVAARAAAALARRVGQPAVVGEIMAGLVLGPSVFGRFLPGWFARVFDPSVGPVFTVIAQLGLVFLLFLVGLEFDFAHLKTRSRTALAVSFSGVALPFALGWGLALWMNPRLDQPVDRWGFALFMGTAMSITAIPILGRIMMELGITRTRLGALTITAAAVDDAFGWILLAAVSAYVRALHAAGSGVGGLTPLADASGSRVLLRALGMLGLTLGFALLMLVLGRFVLRPAVRWLLRRGGGELDLTAMAAVLVVLFLCAIATSLIGIFAIFGAFLLGAVMSPETEFREAVGRKLSHFVTAFFLPIFFTYTGLRTDVGTLATASLWLLAGMVLAAAVVGKFAGCTIAARVAGLRWRESACVGVMMNTRALMELIVINVGYELGVIGRCVFCMLVMMAVITTVMTTPLLLWLTPGTELDAPIEASGFRGAARLGRSAATRGAGAG